MSRLTSKLLEEAWIGDAVLALYVRSRILIEDGRVDGEKAVRMSSNQFLSGIGEPSHIEAEIGRVYAQDGLHAAFQWIESRLIPLFLKQEHNRIRRQGRSELA